MPETRVEVWAAYFAGRVADQGVRKESLERRGAAVLTSSATFVTLVFGLVAVITGADDFGLPDDARAPITLGLVLLTAAALASLGVSWPRKYKNADFDRVDGEELVDQTPTKAVGSVALTNLEIYRESATNNDKKARWLTGSMTLQAAGVLATAWAVFEILSD